MSAATRRAVLAATILGSAVVFIDSTVVNVALPALRADLHATLAQQQWIVVAYLLVLGSLVLVGGSLGDLFGRRRIFAAGLAGFGAASTLCAVAPGPELLIGARALQGLGGALLVPSSLAIITASFHEPARSAAIGTWTAWTSAMIALGPPIGGLLVDTVSWRAVFLLNLPLIAACLWLVPRLPPGSDPLRCVGEQPTQRNGSDPVDVLGGALCALGLGGPVFALIRQPDLGWGAPGVVAGLAGGAAALAAFVAWEARHPAPMLPLGIFRARTFSVGNIATLGVYAGLGAATFFLSLFLQEVAGYGALEAGLALLPISLLLLALSRRAGALSARLGPRWLMGGGPLVAGAGLLLCLRIGGRAPYATEVLPAVAVFGLGMALTFAPLTATVLGSAPAAHAGVASGVNNAVARVAGLLAIAVVGAFVAAAFTAELERRAPGLGQHVLESARRRPFVGVAGHEAAARGASVVALHRAMVVSASFMLAAGVLCLTTLRPAGG